MPDYSDTLVSHEWLAPHGGSENVFEQVAAALPGSRRQCLWNDAPARFGADVAETWLARTPLRKSKAAALPFFASAWKTVNLDPFDCVVASSHAFGHQLAFRAAKCGKDAFAYIHTPARYIWNPDLDERGRHPLARAAGWSLRRQDRAHTSDLVQYAANSEFVRKRVQLAWGQDAAIIYPPVKVAKIQSVADWSSAVNGPEQSVLENLPDTFVLGASRLIEYKRLDLAMIVGQALGLPVVVAGGGPFEDRLRTLAEAVSVPVTFTGPVSDALLYALYQRAALFVFMAVEDFGIMPVEAIAAGTPVLANEIGGAAESVSLLGGGASIAATADATGFREAATKAMTVDRVAARNAAVRLDEAEFRNHIRAWIGNRR